VPSTTIMDSSGVLEATFNSLVYTRACAREGFV
jgi:hypothetical protein